MSFLCIWFMVLAGVHGRLLMINGELDPGMLLVDVVVSGYRSSYRLHVPS